MRLFTTLSPAAALLLAAGLHAQEPGPTTGGTVPPPTSPTTGGTATVRSTAPAGATLIFPTDPAATARAAAATTTATSTAGSFPTLAFQLPGVPTSLNMTDAQQRELTAALQQVQSRFQPQFDRLSALPANEQDAARTALNQQYLAAWLAAARTFLNSNQLARVQQLQLQFGGFASLSDPVAQGALRLTPSQLALLKQDQTWSAQQEAAIQQAARSNQAQAVQLNNAFQAAAQVRMNQLLTPAQQQSWTQLTGSPFAFQPTFPATAAGTTAAFPAGTATVTRTPATPPTTNPATAPTAPTAPMTSPATAPTAPPTAPVPNGGFTPVPVQPGVVGPTTGGPSNAPAGPTTGGPATAPLGPTTGGPAPGPTPRLPPGTPGTTVPGMTGPGGRVIPGSTGPAIPTSGGFTIPGITGPGTNNVTRPGGR